MEYEGRVSNLARIFMLDFHTLPPNFCQNRKETTVATEISENGGKIQRFFTIPGITDYGAALNARTVLGKTRNKNLVRKTCAHG